MSTISVNQTHSLTYSWVVVGEPESVVQELREAAGQGQADLQVPESG